MRGRKTMVTRRQAPKRKAQSSARSTPSPEAESSESEQNEEDKSLPAQITNAAPLPTVRSEFTLPDRSLQSIAASGVLAASLERSRQRWLAEGLFEKYWTRPSKKKNYVADPKNPAKETMQKLGHCKIIIEPHILEANLHAIREPGANPSPSLPVSMANPIMQYSPSTANSPAAYVSQKPKVTQQRYRQASAIQRNSPQIRQTNFSPANNGANSSLASSPVPPSVGNQPIPSPNADPGPLQISMQTPTQAQSPAAAQTSSETSSHAPPRTSSHDQSQAPSTVHPPLSGHTLASPISTYTPTQSPAPRPAPPSSQARVPPPAQATPKQPSQDPVIQMLAHRASTNPDLKVLMKIVASGSASPDQLKVFQGHIDDLTAILNRERERESMIKKPPISTPIPKPPVMHNGSIMTHNNPAPPAPPAPNIPYRPSQQQGMTPSTTFHAPATFHQPQAIKLATPTVQKAEITGIAIEFTGPGTSSDRFLFPKDSILEFVPQSNQIVASFLLVRKPDVFTGGRYVATEEYYQPITIRILAEAPKLFDALSRAVSPPEDVRKRMQEIISSTKRAENTTLALRLPFENESDEAGEGSGAGTPARTMGAKASDKRFSIAKGAVSATQSPSAVGVSAKKDKPLSWQDWHCQFCWSKVPLPPEEIDNMPVCSSCSNLRRIDAFKNPMSYSPFRSSNTKNDTRSSGQQNLML